MFFLNFFILFPFYPFSGLLMKFQDFPELINERNSKKFMLRKFFYFRMKELRFFFRFSFPFKTSGASIIDQETYLDYVFETKYKVELEIFDSKIFIGQANLKKGSFTAISFPYIMENFTQMPTSPFKEKSSFLYSFEKKRNPYLEKFEFFLFSSNFRSKKKNSLSLCLSISKISNATSVFFFDYFIERKRKIQYFKLKKSKDSLFPFNLKTYLKKMFLYRLSFHIFRSSVFPFFFPFEFFKGKKIGLMKGVFRIFFSLGHFLKNCFFFSPSLLSIRTKKLKNIGLDYANFILQKKKRNFPV